MPLDTCIKCEVRPATEEYWPCCGPECHDAAYYDFADAGGFEYLEMIADKEAERLEREATRAS
jgi:hypothetical protein